MDTSRRTNGHGVSLANHWSGSTSQWLGNLMWLKTRFRLMEKFTLSTTLSRRSCALSWSTVWGIFAVFSTQYSAQESLLLFWVTLMSSSIQEETFYLKYIARTPYKISARSVIHMGYKTRHVDVSNTTHYTCTIFEDRIDHSIGRISVRGTYRPR